MQSFVRSLRKVKMDQRKLMDNANTITDMAKVRHLSLFLPSPQLFNKIDEILYNT